MAGGEHLMTDFFKSLSDFLIVVFAGVWLTVLPTIGLLWCIGWLQ